MSAEDKFNYSSEARSDVDFPASDGRKVSRILVALKTHDWYKQSPAISEISQLSWAGTTQDEIFVLGRNIYQCACGGERKAVAFVQNLRSELAKIPINVAEHLLNGMFYEIYFDSKGKFRGQDLKDGHLAEVFSVQTVAKYKGSISFIRQTLTPYRRSLAILPNSTPEVVELKVKIEKKNPPIVTSIKYGGRELLAERSAVPEPSFARAWRLSFREFSVQTLMDTLCRAWHVPREQLKISTTPKVSDQAELRLLDGKVIAQHFA